MLADNLTSIRLVDVIPVGTPPRWRASAWPRSPGRTGAVPANPPFIAVRGNHLFE